MVLVKSDNTGAFRCLLFLTVLRWWVLLTDKYTDGSAQLLAEQFPDMPAPQLDYTTRTMTWAPQIADVLLSACHIRNLW